MKDTVGRKVAELGRKEEQCFEGEEKARVGVSEGSRWQGGVEWCGY